MASATPPPIDTLDVVAGHGHHIIGSQGGAVDDHAVRRRHEPEGIPGGRYDGGP